MNSLHAEIIYLDRQGSVRARINYNPGKAGTYSFNAYQGGDSELDHETSGQEDSDYLGNEYVLSPRAECVP